ncbi:MAG: BrxA family protein [Opitutales bacterium]
MDADETTARRPKLSHTAVTLGLREANVILEVFEAAGSWERAAERIVAENRLQKTSSSSTRRICREMRQRLEGLTPQTLQQFTQLTLDDQKSVLLIAVCKAYPFFFGFVRGPLADKAAVHDFAVSPTDFDRYWEAATLTYPTRP